MIRSNKWIYLRLLRCEAKRPRHACRDKNRNCDFDNSLGNMVGQYIHVSGDKIFFVFNGEHLDKLCDNPRTHVFNRVLMVDLRLATNGDDKLGHYRLSLAS